MDDETIKETRVREVMYQFTSLCMQIDFFVKSAKGIVDDVKELEGSNYAEIFKENVIKLENAKKELASFVEGVLPG